MPPPLPYDETDPQWTGTAHGDIRVFVVEDEAVIAMDLADQLTNLGYTLCGTSARGETALQQMKEARPTLVLMDINLAGAMDGIETAQRIREQHKVPVVFLTAYSDQALITRASQSGGYGYLVKPFEARELHATIQVALARAKANAALETRVAERTRELTASVADLESFTGMVAHDLLSPLRGIAGYARIIKEEHAANLGGDAAFILSRIEGSALRLGAMIDGLLAFSRLGSKPARRAATDMRQLVKTIPQELQARLAGRSVNFETGAMPDAACNAGLVEQVWRNLLENAIKFTAGRDPAVITAGFDGKPARGMCAITAWAST